MNEDFFFELSVCVPATHPARWAARWSDPARWARTPLWSRTQCPRPKPRRWRSCWRWFQSQTRRCRQQEEEAWSRRGTWPLEKEEKGGLESRLPDASGPFRIELPLSTSWTYGIRNWWWNRSEWPLGVRNAARWSADPRTWCPASGLRWCRSSDGQGWSPLAKSFESFSVKKKARRCKITEIFTVWWSRRLFSDLNSCELTTRHFRMYWVMWADGGGFHWMGWELGWFPDSVMITCTGRWPPGREKN